MYYGGKLVMKVDYPSSASYLWYALFVLSPLAIAWLKYNGRTLFRRTTSH